MDSHPFNKWFSTADLTFVSSLRTLVLQHVLHGTGSILWGSSGVTNSPKLEAPFR